MVNPETTGAEATCFYDTRPATHRVTWFTRSGNPRSRDLCEQHAQGGQRDGLTVAPITQTSESENATTRD